MEFEKRLQKAAIVSYGMPHWTEVLRLHNSADFDCSDLLTIWIESCVNNFHKVKRMDTLRCSILLCSVL